MQLGKTRVARQDKACSYRAPTGGVIKGPQQMFWDVPGLFPLAGFVRLNSRWGCISAISASEQGAYRPRQLTCMFELCSLRIDNVRLASKHSLVLHSMMCLSYFQGSFVIT